MKKVKITVLKKTLDAELAQEYGAEGLGPCPMLRQGQTFEADYAMPEGTAEELAKLDASYEHLCKMRDELVELNITPAISEWSKINPNL